MMDSNKPHIRLPGDDDHGPNPYSSKTEVKELQKNRWLWDWRWWAGIVAMALLLVWIQNR